MRVLLYGISHLKNFGCEAIIRSTYEALKTIDRNIEIVYASREAESDQEIIQDLDIAVVQLSREPDFLSRVVNKMASIFNCRFRIVFDDYRKVCKGIDLMISVGGDIFTIEKDLICGRRKKRFNNRIIAADSYAKRKGIKLVLYGASVGPFPKYKGNEKYYLKHLNIFDLIICRENWSIDYLENIGCSAEIQFAPDPAFWLGNCKSPEQRSGIGINLSRRILSSDYSKEAQILEIAALLMRISDRFKEPIRLIPHVYSSSYNDDDYTFMKEIYESVHNEYKDRIILLDTRDLGFIGTKSILAQQRIVIAARMHCAINAISEGVPTILISYSQKSIGMAKAVYGNDEWVIADFLVLQELENLIEEILYQETSIRHHLISQMKEFTSAETRKIVLKMLKRVM